jgi:hypothetical protein
VGNDLGDADLEHLLGFFLLSKRNSNGQNQNEDQKRT